MDGFLHTLLTMSLTAAIAAGVVMLLRLPLKQVPRWITCLLWAVVLLRMVCPVGFSLPVSLMPETVSSGAYVERVFPQAETPASTPQAATTTTTAPAATTQTPVTRETVAVTPTGPDCDTVLTILWAAGGIACFAWGAISYLRLRLRIADAILIEKNIYETDQIDSPFVCGFFQPRIYLPVGLAEPDRRYVLLHEQAHIRRRDYLTKPLAYLALCFHWFNPVLWLSYHLFGRDLETATDQAVIRSFGRTDTAGYAAALLHLGHKPSFPQAVPLAFGEENPKHRIRSVLSYKKPAFWVILAAVAACVILGTLLLADLRPGMTQLGTSQAEPTVAYANGTAYAIQLDDQILVRSSSKKWTARDITSVSLQTSEDGKLDTLYLVPFAEETCLYPQIDSDTILSVAAMPSGRGLIVSTLNRGYYCYNLVDQVFQAEMLIPAEAKPFYPLEISPDEKQVISSNRAPGETGASLYLYNLDTYESKCLFPGSPEDTVFPLGWLDDNTLLIARQSGYAALTLDGQTFPLAFACNDAFVRTVRDGLVVYTYDQDTTNAPSPWTADHTLYVARYENGNLTTILKEDDVLPRGRDAAFVSPHGDKLLFLCATLGHQGPGPGVRQECWVYDLTTGKHTAHFPPDGENGETQLIGSACWLDNDTLLLAHREDTLSGENPYPYTISTTKA